MEYAETQMGYRVLDLESHSFHVSRDIRFLEHEFPFKSNSNIASGIMKDFLVLIFSTTSHELSVCKNDTTYNTLADKKSEVSHKDQVKLHRMKLNV